MTFANKIWIFLQISVSVKWQCCQWLKGKVVSFVHFVLYYSI